MRPIFDNGHGGVIGGQYQTPGKRSPNWECGILYEGMFNRWVVNRLIEKMDRSGLEYYSVCPELKDIPLWKRVERANKINAFDRNTYFLSIHANAGDGKGIEGFTSKGRTQSDVVGEIILQNLQIDLIGTQVFRFDTSDGDRDKESNFYVLRNTKCAAFLLECGFMDNKVDYKKLWDQKYLEQLVDSIFRSIVQLNKK